MAHCQTCAHYATDGSECRRYAPQPTEADAKAQWPTVSAQDWCGEYKPDAEKERGSQAA